jgi:carbonic anhydrase
MRFLLALASASLLAAADHHEPAPGVAPVDAMVKLAAGNARFAYGARTRSARPGEDAARRNEIAPAQHPFAAVLTCADSRLAPELIFDATVGDLFVVRNAGNVSEPVGLGSLEYAIAHLGVRVIVVLGHGSCGAVKAVCGSAGELPGNLAAIQHEMAGLKGFADTRQQAGAETGAVIADAVAYNAEAQAAALRTESPVLAAAEAAGSLLILSAVYDLATGLVTFHPAAKVTPASEAAPAAPTSHGH